MCVSMWAHAPFWCLLSQSYVRTDPPTWGLLAPHTCFMSARLSTVYRVRSVFCRSLCAPGVTAGEEREMYDRRRKLLLYALRSPFLEATTL
jgi:hypothetical protein